MRENVRDFVSTITANFDLAEPIVEVGSLQIEGQEGFADLRAFAPGKTYIGCDMRAGTGVDQIEDVEAGLSFETGSVGTLLCLDTLEHVFDIQAAFHEFRRVLQPGGLLALSSVMFFPIHGHPYDYWRFTPECFSRLLAAFDRYHVMAEGEPDFPHTVYGLATLEPVPRPFDNMAARVMEYVRTSPQDGRGCTWQPSRPWPVQADATNHLLSALERQTNSLTTLATTVATAIDGRDQAQLSEVRELLAHRDEEVQALRAERDTQDERIQALLCEQTQLRADLERVLTSRPLRLYRRLRGIPGLRTVARLLLS